MQNNEGSTINQVFEKLKQLFSIDSEGKYDPKLFLVSQCVGGGSIAGFLIGGRIGARVAGIEHIENSALEVYSSTAHAHRQYHGRVILGFVRNGCRFGWRAGIFSGLYSLLLVTFEELSEEKNKATNFLYAGAFTGIAYKSLSGWRSVVVGGIIGSALSVPAAGFTAVVNKLAPESLKDKLNIFQITSHQIERQEVEEKDGRIDNEFDHVVSVLESSAKEDILKR